MSDQNSTFLSQVDGFIPVIDVLAQELGLMEAVVYGIVWRYCQMDDKICYASQETIARHANISRKTVHRHITRLCERGYLEDKTPERQGTPHVYADTGKAKIIGLVKAVVGGGTESPRGWDRESQVGGTESPTRRVSHDSNKEIPSPPAKIPEKDYLDSILETAQRGDGKSGVATPTDDPGLYFQYRDDAIKVYLSEAGNRTLAPAMKKAIGDLSAGPGFDLDFWRQVVKEYVKLGWNPSNIRGMIDFYDRHELPKGKGGSHATNSHRVQQTHQNIEHMAATGLGPHYKPSPGEDA